MNCKPWTLALIGAGLVSLPAVAWAEEKPSAVLTSLSATTISGYVDTSAQWNFGTGNTHAPVYPFGGASKADGFNLNVVQLKIEKPVEGSDVWGAGYKADLIFGPDADTLSTQSTLSTGKSDFGIKQAYVALHAPVGNGLDFKVGVWDTLMGYEVFESINNPNFTRSYGYGLEPTTHTGVQGSYVFGEALSATAGVVDTFGSQINQRANPPKAESYKAYMGSLTLTAPKSMGFLAGSTLTGCVMNGFNSGVGPAGADQTSFYVGASVNTPVSGLKVGACYDYVGISHQPLFNSAYGNAVGGYLTYQATEKLALNFRGEYASSDLMTTGAPALPVLGARQVIETTATLQYDLWKNVLSRLEFRWDHAADGSKAFGADDGTGFGTKKNSFILLANVSYKF